MRRHSVAVPVAVHYQYYDSLGSTGNRVCTRIRVDSARHRDRHALTVPVTDTLVFRVTVAGTVAQLAAPAAGS